MSLKLTLVDAPFHKVNYGAIHPQLRDLPELPRGERGECREGEELRSCTRVSTALYLARSNEERARRRGQPFCELNSNEAELGQFVNSNNPVNAISRNADRYAQLLSKG